MTWKYFTPEYLAAMPDAMLEARLVSALLVIGTNEQHQADLRALLAEAERRADQLKELRRKACPGQCCDEPPVWADEYFPSEPLEVLAVRGIRGFP